MTVGQVASPPGPPRHRRRLFLLVAIAGTAVLLSALFAFGLSRESTAIQSPLLGEPAPDFSLRTIEDGRVIRLSELRGEVVVLNFWASWCGPCREEHPNFVAAWERYRDRGVILIGIVFEDSPENARQFMAELGGDWRSVIDPGARTALAYGVYGIPETFFIDRAGVVRHKRIGISSYELLVTQIERLLGTG
jgi:cytochrome c biogenesis protein CcmG/thiol:disulfide interchange protein DsbE